MVSAPPPPVIVHLKPLLPGAARPPPRPPPPKPPAPAPLASAPPAPARPVAPVLPAVPAPELPPMRMRRPTPIFSDIHDVVLPAPGTVPANPFSSVSDNAIEYFVEWSLESNVGPHKESTASF